MTIHIKPMSEFPYDVNRREGTYHLEGEIFDRALIKPNNYCVGYEGNNPALACWCRKQSKELTNLASHFPGGTAVSINSNLYTSSSQVRNSMCSEF